MAKSRKSQSKKTTSRKPRTTSKKKAGSGKRASSPKKAKARKKAASKGKTGGAKKKAAGRKADSGQAAPKKTTPKKAASKKTTSKKAASKKAASKKTASKKTKGAKSRKSSSAAKSNGSGDKRRSNISRRDPLQVYMREVQRHPLLSPEEEYELAVSFREEGDLDAARELITANLRLVVKIAYDYRRAYRNLLDLVQEGNIGLMQAVKKYDPYKGVKLSSYAAWWIRAYILRFILNNWRLVKVGTTQAQRKLFFNLQKEKSRLSAMGIDPTPEAIAERLNVSTKDVISMDRRLTGGEVSLDAPVGTGEGRPVSRVDLMPSGGSRIDDFLADEEINDKLKAKIHEFGGRLQNKEKIIFDERLLAEDPRTLQELGTQFGVSRERVRQIEKRLLQKLRNYLGEELGQGVLDVYQA